MSKNRIISALEEEQIQRELPDFGPGDTLVVQVKVKEGNRERLQAFEGVVIGVRSRGLNSAFTLRKISHGVGVERTFQAFSPMIDSITVKRRGDVRQAKLYYLRERSGRSADPGSSGRAPRVSAIPAWISWPPWRSRRKRLGKRPPLRNKRLGFAPPGRKKAPSIGGRFFA